MTGLRWSEENWLAWKNRQTNVVPLPAPQRGPEAIHLALPWPPSTGNTAVRHAGGRHYLTTAQKDYRRRTLEMARAMKIVPLLGKLKVTIHVAPPTRRAVDLDNVAKVVLDALAKGAGVIRSDADVDWLTLRREPIVKGGAIFVWVEPMP